MNEQNKRRSGRSFLAKATVGLTALMLAVAPARGQDFQLSGQSGHELVTIDPVSGVATRAGDTGDRFVGLAFDSAGTLYGVALTYLGGNTLLLADKGSSLFALTSSGNLTPLGSLDHRSKGLAFVELDLAAADQGDPRSSVDLGHGMVAISFATSPHPGWQGQAERTAAGTPRVNPALEPGNRTLLALVFPSSRASSRRRRRAGDSPPYSSNADPGLPQKSRGNFTLLASGRTLGLSRAPLSPVVSCTHITQEQSP